MAKKKTADVPEYRPHPLAERFPMMDQPAFEALKADIAERGLENSIWLFEGKVLDGRNRYRALIELGIFSPGHCEQFDGDAEAAAAFVDSQNLHRRHLSQADQERLRSERIQRVAEARREGKSLRTIATEEGVSPEQVRQDIQAATVKGLTVEPEGGKVQGRDGKTRTATPARKPEMTPDETQANAQAVLDQWKDKPVGTTATVALAPKAAPIVDGWGVPIQPHALEAFLSLPRFRELIGLVKQARKVFNEIAQREGGQFLQRKDVSAYRRTGTDDDGQEQGKFVSHALEQALKQIENAQPQHTACPWNHVDGPHPDPCPTCLGLNWTPALGGSIPPMAVERIKEKYGV